MAYLLTSVFIFISLATLTALHRQILTLCSLGENQSVLDRDPAHALQTGLAQALTLLRTQTPPANPYSCQLALTGVAGQPAMVASYRQNSGEWNVNVVLGTDVSVSACPDTFASAM
jgi:hypothetical protein